MTSIAGGNARLHGRAWAGWSTVLSRRLRARPDPYRAERIAYLERLTALNRAGALTDQELSDARRALAR